MNSSCLLLQCTFASLHELWLTAQSYRVCAPALPCMLLPCHLFQSHKKCHKALGLVAMTLGQCWCWCQLVLGFRAGMMMHCWSLRNGGKLHYQLALSLFRVGEKWGGSRISWREGRPWVVLGLGGGWRWQTLLSYPMPPPEPGNPTQSSKAGTDPRKPIGATICQHGVRKCFFLYPMEICGCFPDPLDSVVLL